MRKRRLRRKPETAAKRSGHRRVLALVLISIVVSAGAILGQRLGAFSQTSRKMPAPSQQDAAITPASFDSPSKEYIYAGGKLLATEEPEGGGPPTHHASTIGLFRPSGNLFLLRNSNISAPPDITVAFGAPGDLPVVGDWDGDGTVTIGLYRPSISTFFLRNTNATGPPPTSLCPSAMDPMEIFQSRETGTGTESGRSEFIVRAPRRSICATPT